MLNQRARLFVCKKYRGVCGVISHTLSGRPFEMARIIASLKELFKVLLNHHIFFAESAHFSAESAHFLKSIMNAVD